MQWPQKLIAYFKDIVDSCVCVSQQDIYRKAKVNGEVVPKANSICPMQ